jgi:hypothetical protein
MYLDLIESFMVWLQSRGVPPEVAIIRALSGFSAYAVGCFVAVILLVNVFAGIPIAQWLGGHLWAFGIVGLLIAFAHWRLARSLKQRMIVRPSLTEGRPSRFLWVWYFLPAFGLFLYSVGVALTRAHA